MGNEHSSQRQAQTKTQQQSDERAIASKPNQATRAAVHPLLQLQRQIGNRAVTQLIQAKLTVNPADDIYEQEADRTALAVVNTMNTPASPIAQRLEMPEEEEKIQTLPMIQRMSAESGMEVTPQLEDSIQQARGGGQPLAGSIREPMEQAFGANFSGVRIHTDNQADQLNRSIQAKAFTTGQDVFFRQGAYEPGSRGGQELIAHELTHVEQQRRGGERTFKIQRSAAYLPGTKLGKYGRLVLESAEVGAGKDFKPDLKERVLEINNVTTTLSTKFAQLQTVFNLFCSSDLSGHLVSRLSEFKAEVAELDHIYPKQKDGANSVHNIQVLTGTENNAKRASYPWGLMPDYHGATLMVTDPVARIPAIEKFDMFRITGSGPLALVDFSPRLGPNFQSVPIATARQVGLAPPKDPV